MKIYTTVEYMSNDISFENKKHLTTKMKLYTTGEYISNDISIEKYKKKPYYKNETLHNWRIYK